MYITYLLNSKFDLPPLIYNPWTNNPLYAYIDHYYPIGHILNKPPLLVLILN